LRLETLQQHWDALGEDDPLWAILSTPDKRGGAWNLDEFLATGPREVDEILESLRIRGIELEHGRALDFGCGIGWLTQALADQFPRCDGVDLAASMIELAVAVNRQGERCRYHHNPAPDLRLFGDESFDFVLSLLVLQHMEPTLMKGYVAEFVRVLRPQGVAFFNIPAGLVVGSDLPTAAVRASVECRGAPQSMAPGEVATVGLRVRNASDVLWPASARLLVGNHWLAGDGALLVHDDGRGAIDGAIPAGGVQDVELAVVAPDLPGSYQLEVDVLQEQKGWFASLGSPTLRVPVVVPASVKAADAQDPRRRRSDILVPRIEMHVMSRKETVAVIEEAGGTVLDVIARDRCGPSAPSYDYVVGRSPTTGGHPRPKMAKSPADRQLAPPSPVRPPPSDGLWAARADIGERADLVSFALSSRRRVLGPPSILARRLLRRALREVLYRQTEFNRAGVTLLQELESQNEQLQTRVEAQDELLATLRERLQSLEASRDPSARQEGPDTGKTMGGDD
jgi:SAM-dependent methyltransferase